MADASPSDRPQLLPHIAAMKAYVPGRSTGDGGQKLIKLSANENPLGCSPAALAALDNGHQPQYYPDPDAAALREAIAAAHDLDAARIVCGAGSGELLSCAVQAYAGPGDEVLFSRYAFSLYPLLTQKVAAQAVLAAPAGDDGVAASVDNLLAAVTDKTRIVLLDNPNNPTGTYLPPAEVERLHRGLAPHILLVLDQAYAEYLPHAEAAHALRLAEAHANVLVTRTFSKAHGLAAERIGWATGHGDIIAGINRLRGPFNVSASGQRAALAAITDAGFVEHSRQHNTRVRRAFTRRLASLGNRGIAVVPSEANFVLVRFTGTLTATAAMAALAQAGYAVRHLSDLDDALRITIGTARDMEAVADCLASASENAG